MTAMEKQVVTGILTPNSAFPASLACIIVVVLLFSCYFTSTFQAFVLIYSSSSHFISLCLQGSLFIAGGKINTETSAYLTKVEIKGAIKTQMMKPKEYMNTGES